MKQSFNGIIAYYPNYLMRKIISVFAFLVALPLISGFVYVGSGSVSLGCLMLVLSIFLGWASFFPVAICTVYPEKLEWSTRSLFAIRTKRYCLLWEEISSFYLREEWIRLEGNGKVSSLVKVLCIKTKTSKKYSKIIRFHLLSNKDQESLLSELRAHGIPQQNT